MSRTTSGCESSGERVFLEDPGVTASDEAGPRYKKRPEIRGFRVEDRWRQCPPHVLRGPRMEPSGGTEAEVSLAKSGST
jgi:hypothetical protein